MLWVPLIVWLAAVVVALVVLGFCGYELAWKARRLRGDLAQLQALTARLEQMQQTLGAARERVTEAARPAAPIR